MPFATGTVTVTGGTASCTVTLNDIGMGVCNLPSPFSKAGTYTVTASYPGDANYAPMNTSASVTVIDGGDVCSGSNTDSQSLTDFNNNETRSDAPTTSSCGDGTGMCAVTTTLPLVSLRLFDTPVGYTPPVGYDVHTTLTYNQREASQPASMDYSNIGPQWSTSWVGYIQDDPTQPGVSVRRIAAGGGAYDYSGYNSADGTFAREILTPVQLVLTSQNPVTYERRFQDGSKEVYAASNGATAAPRRVFLSRMVDPYGNTLTLNYDASLRLTSVQDAIGQSTVFTYGNTANTWLITAITDPFGRKAQLAYDGQGRLSSITDAVGITSSFDYSGTGTDITALHTPYGTTSFAATTTSTSRSLAITDPLGHVSRTEFNASVTLPDDPPPNASWADGNQGYRNTFYWDGEANARAPGDYTQAHIQHWLSSGTSNPVVTSSLESEKQPLETRQWYLRDGQTSSNFLSGAQRDAPNQIARLLPDGNAQLTQIAYTDSGNPTQSIDPLNRQVQASYDSTGTDITAAQRKTATGADTLAQYTYGAVPHRPVTYTDAAGQVWHMSYNPQGQLLTAT
ncbi:MAG: Ig-like domain repeat protein, partial [Burkholderiaceae bacterium]|nr:Ig-like domain repeat protein [Burkholderiaceae bacterium]